MHVCLYWPVLLVGLLAVSFESFSTNSVLLDIEFDDSVGDYSLPIKLGQSPEKRFLIDLGSRMLEVSSLAYIPKSCKKIDFYFGQNMHLETLIPLSYGSGFAKGALYDCQLTFPKDLYVQNHLVTVDVSGYKLKNVMGMGPTPPTSYIEKFPFDDPVFTILNQLFQFNNQFSLLLCGKHGSSKLLLGPLPKRLKAQNGQHAKSIGVFFHTLSHLAVIGDDGHKILNYSKGKKAILDSGNSAHIYYPEHDYQIIVQYLKGFLKKKNITLSASFWQGACVSKEQIDFDVFPPISFVFQGIDNKPIELKLLPQNYIKKTNCDDRQLRLVFQSFSRKKKLSKPNEFRDMSFGVPFLEVFLTTFDMNFPPKISFRRRRCAL